MKQSRFLVAIVCLAVVLALAAYRPAHSDVNGNHAATLADWDRRIMARLDSDEGCRHDALERRLHDYDVLARQYNRELAHRDALEKQLIDLNRDAGIFFEELGKFAANKLTFNQAYGTGPDNHDITLRRARESLELSNGFVKDLKNRLDKKLNDPATAADYVQGCLDEAREEMSLIKSRHRMMLAEFGSADAWFEVLQEKKKAYPDVSHEEWTRLAKETYSRACRYEEIVNAASRDFGRKHFWRDYDCSNCHLLPPAPKSLIRDHENEKREISLDTSAELIAALLLDQKPTKKAVPWRPWPCP